MAHAEYLALIPLLIYGIGLTDLLSQWHRLFDRENRYPIYLIFTLVLTEVAIYNVVIYVDLVQAFPHQTYFAYLASMVPPILFLMVVNVFTPDEGTQTKAYLFENARLIFSLMAVFVASHYFYPFEEKASTVFQRGLFIFFLLTTAYFRKEWMMYLLAALWLVGLLQRGGMMAG